MRERSRANALILGAVLIIGICVAVYATVFLKWVSAPRPGAGEAVLKMAAAKAEAALVDARRGYRSNLLDPQAHLRLSEALWHAGRHVDSFYVARSARQLFGDDAFRAAHGAVVLRLGGPAAEARKRLAGLSGPAQAVPIHAEVARHHPDTAEGRDSLDTLMRLASADDATGGEAARLARTALEELHRSDPKHPGKLSAFALSALGRNDPGLAQAIANEALTTDPKHAGAAQVMGALTLHMKEPDKAFAWLSAAWDRNPDDLYSAAKLAQLYDKRRNDPEAALPFWLAIHRQNPDYEDGGPVERRIREVLDSRRERLLANAGVESLGRYFGQDDGAIRAEAAARAAEFKDPRWVDALGALLDDDVELVRRSADYALFKIGQQEPEAVRARRDEWLAGDKPLTRIRALNLYADLDGKNAYPRAVAALKDPVPAVRAFAKLMVIDHYYDDMPEATKARAKYLAEERDPEALSLLARFAPPRPARRGADVFVDTHAHLGDPAFDADRDAVFARAASAGVGRVVEIADSPDEWDRAVAIARARPDSVRCTLGLHPYYADRYDAGFLGRLRAALDAAPEAVGVGEIGLDYAKAQVPHDVQRRAFGDILAACRDWGVPVVVHCRDAYMDLVPMLRDAVAGRKPKGRFWGVVHCFSGTPEEAVACAELGFALGADGPVTYKKNDPLREAFRRAGPGVTVLETDSPYLPPQSSRGKRNEPASLVEVAAALAAVWSVTPDAVAAATSRNAADLYAWP